MIVANVLEVRTIWKYEMLEEQMQIIWCYSVGDSGCDNSKENLAKYGILYLFFAEKYLFSPIFRRPVSGKIMWYIDPHGFFMNTLHSNGPMYLFKT